MRSGWSTVEQSSTGGAVSKKALRRDPQAAHTSRHPPKGAGMSPEQLGRYGVGRGSGTERELHLPGSNDVPTGQRRIASFREVVVEYLDFIANPTQDRQES